MRKLVLIAVFILLGGQQVAAAPPDLAACRFGNGIAMDPDECQVTRRLAAEEQQRRALQAAAIDRAMAQAGEDAAAEKQRRAAQQAEANRLRAEHAARQRAQMQQLDARREAEDKADAREAVAATAARSAMKARCGGDYLAPRVGMSIQRAKECVSASLKVTAQLNRKDGVVTTYRSGSGAQFHVMDGVIVAWAR